MADGVVSSYGTKTQDSSVCGTDELRIQVIALDPIQCIVSACRMDILSPHGAQAVAKQPLRRLVTAFPNATLSTPWDWGRMDELPPMLSRSSPDHSGRNSC